MTSNHTPPSLEDALKPGLTSQERAMIYIDFFGDALDAAYGFRFNLVQLLDAHARDAKNTNPKAGGFPQHLTMEDRSFEAALSALKRGHRVHRDGWNGKGMWLKVQVPDHHSKMTLPYIYMSTATGDLVPWLASQSDLLAEDWHVLED